MPTKVFIVNLVSPEYCSEDKMNMCVKTTKHQVLRTKIFPCQTSCSTDGCRGFL